MTTNRLVEKVEVATYASVLFDAAHADGGIDTILSIRSEMEIILNALRSDMDLASSLNSADYSPEQRAQMAKNVFAGSNPLLVETMAVMASRGDIELYARVFDAYDKNLADKLNTCVVDVTTVVELNDELRHTITQKIEADMGMKAVLVESIDKSILGGIVMSTNGKRIDASVLSRLNNARIVLKENSDGGES